MTCQQSGNQKKKILFSKDNVCMIESEVSSQVPEEELEYAHELTTLKSLRPFFTV